MELVAILIALAVVVFGGRGFKRSLDASPAIAALHQAPARFGLPRIIAVGVLTTIVLYHLTN